MTIEKIKKAYEHSKKRFGDTDLWIIIDLCYRKAIDSFEKDLGQAYVCIRCAHVCETYIVEDDHAKISEV